MRHLVLALLLVPMLLSRSPANAAEDAAEPPEPAGMWRGELDPPEGLRAKPLQLVLHIRHGKEGYLATIDGLGPAVRDIVMSALSPDPRRRAPLAIVRELLETTLRR